MKNYTEDELDFFTRSELLEIAKDLGILKFIPKNASLPLIKDSILESQEEVGGN